MIPGCVCLSICTVASGGRVYKGIFFHLFACVFSLWRRSSQGWTSTDRRYCRRVPTAGGAVLDDTQHASQGAKIYPENTKRWIDIQSPRGKWLSSKMTWSPTVVKHAAHVPLRTYPTVVLQGQMGFSHVEIRFCAFFITLHEREWLIRRFRRSEVISSPLATQRVEWKQLWFSGHRPELTIKTFLCICDQR